LIASQNIVARHVPRPMVLEPKLQRVVGGIQGDSEHHAATKAMGRHKNHALLRIDTHGPCAFFCSMDGNLPLLRVIPHAIFGRRPGSASFEPGRGWELFFQSSHHFFSFGFGTLLLFEVRDDDLCMAGHGALHLSHIAIGKSFDNLLMGQVYGRLVRRTNQDVRRDRDGKHPQGDRFIKLHEVRVTAGFIDEAVKLVIGQQVSGNVAGLYRAELIGQTLG